MAEVMSRVKAERRAGARAKMQEQARVDSGLIDSATILNVLDVGRGP